MDILPLDMSHLARALEFSNKIIGDGYFTETDLKSFIRVNGLSPAPTSFGLFDGDQILGLRLSSPPGHWPKRVLQKKLYRQNWPFPPESAAYFQSLFLAPAARRKGWGPKLSKVAISALEKWGAAGIVTHSWKESPGASSEKYLSKLGFKAVGETPDFWAGSNYICERCGHPPCRCTAIEMVKLMPQSTSEKLG